MEFDLEDLKLINQSITTLLVKLDKLNQFGNDQDRKFNKPRIIRLKRISGILNDAMKAS